MKEGDATVIIRRAFPASPDEVFDALTVPALLKIWMTEPGRWTLDVCDVDLRAGKSFRSQWLSADGATFAIHGSCKAVQRPSHLAAVLYREGGGADENDATEVTVELRQNGLETAVTTTCRFSSPVARDAAASSGMNAAIAASFARLNDLLAQQSPPEGQ